ncbi:hypothetical protein [uncultured Clostridium sp.]|nr:hypothetical protein [uncultured Clostridium sp.]
MKRRIRLWLILFVGTEASAIIYNIAEIAKTNNREILSTKIDR